MQIEDYFDFLSPDDIQLKGHRIGVETVLYEYVYNALSPEELAARFPTLSLEQIHATLLYYLHNKAAMDAYLVSWLAHGEQMRAEQARHPTPDILKLRRARAEREQMAADTAVAAGR